jgi:effector-binding domain-containing protein
MAIEIITREKEQVLEIVAFAPTWKLPFIMGGAYKKISSYLTKNNAQPSGAPYARYLNLDWTDLEKGHMKGSFFKNLTKKWEMRLGFPVGEKLDGEGTVQPSYFPEGRFLKTLHTGPYKKVSETYMAIIRWAKEHNFELRNESAEFYLNDPRTTSKKNLQTMVLVPIKD